MKKTRIIIAGLFAAAGLVFKFALVGYSFLGYTLMAVAACVIYFGILKKYESSKICRGARIASGVILGLLAIAFVITEARILEESSGTSEPDADYLVILGAGVNGTEPSLSLKNRLNAAIVYLLQNPDTVCIASGGKGPGEDISEAECMYRYLTSHGIESERVIKEDKSSDTSENVENSLEIISNLGKPNYTVAVVSSEYHLYRAKLMFADYGINVGTIPGKTTFPVLKLNYFLREVPATWAYMIFG